LQLLEESKRHQSTAAQRIAIPSAASAFPLGQASRLQPKTHKEQFPLDAINWCVKLPPMVTPTLVKDPFGSKKKKQLWYDEARDQ
jgi:hypothetical protein